MPNEPRTPHDCNSLANESILWKHLVTFLSAMGARYTHTAQPHLLECSARVYRISEKSTLAECHRLLCEIGLSRGHRVPRKVV